MFQGQVGILSSSEKDWVERRAKAVAEEKGWPLPVAHSEAIRQLAYAKAHCPKARVLVFPSIERKVISTNSI